VAAAPGPAPSVSPGTTGASLGSLVSVVVTPPAPLAPAVQPAADAIAALTSAAPTSGSVPGHPLAPVAGALRSLVAGLPGVTDPAGLMSVVVPLRSELGDRAATGGARLAPDLAQVTGVKGFADAAFAAPRVAIELGTGASRGLDALGHALVGGADGALSAAVGSAGGSGSGPSAAVVALFTFTIAALWRRVRPAARTALAPAFLFGSARPG
jgi:hypothetical protein